MADKHTSETALQEYRKLLAQEVEVQKEVYQLTAALAFDTAAAEQASRRAAETKEKLNTASLKAHNLRVNAAALIYQAPTIIDAIACTKPEDRAGALPDAGLGRHYLRLLEKVEAAKTALDTAQAAYERRHQHLDASMRRGGADPCWLAELQRCLTEDRDLANACFNKYEHAKEELQFLLDNEPVLKAHVVTADNAKTVDAENRV